MAHLLERAGFTPDSHSGKDLVQVMENYPRDELLQTDPDDLVDIALSVMHLQERRKTKLFLRYDIYERFVSALIYLPRDRYNTTVRLKMEDILRRTFDAESVDYTTRVSESALARLHFVVRVPEGRADPAGRRVRAGARDRRGDPDLGRGPRRGPARGRGRRGRRPADRVVRQGFPRGVQGGRPPPGGGHGHPSDRDARLRRRRQVGLHQEPGCPPDERRFKLYRRGPLTLTRVLPMFTHLGVEVIDERPYEITRSDGVRVYVYDFGLRTTDRSRSGASATTATHAGCGSRTPSARCGRAPRSPTASTRSSSAPG